MDLWVRIKTKVNIECRTSDRVSRFHWEEEDVE